MISSCRLKSSDKVPFSLAFDKTSPVESIANILIVAVTIVIRMVRWFAAFSPLNVTNVGNDSTIQASEEKTVLTETPPIASRRQMNKTNWCKNAHRICTDEKELSN